MRQGERDSERERERVLSFEQGFIGGILVTIMGQMMVKF